MLNGIGSAVRQKLRTLLLLVNMSRKIAENEYYVQKRWLKANDIIFENFNFFMKMGYFTLPPKMVHLKFLNLRKSDARSILTDSFSNWKITRKTNANEKKIKSGYSNDMIIESWLDFCNGNDLVFWKKNTKSCPEIIFSTEIYKMTRIPNKNPSM